MTKARPEAHPPHVQIDIAHTSSYRYSRPIFLGRQIIRLTPRTDHVQRLIQQEIEVNPEPAGRSQVIGAENNNLLDVWYTELTDFMTLTNRCRVVIHATNPFDYLPFKDLALPVDLPSMMTQDMRPYLRRAGDPGSIAVTEWSNKLRGEAQDDVLDFLNLLNSSLYEGYAIEYRDDGFPWSPEQTLETDRAACRDLAVLFMDACRCQGLPSRFVSGYTYHADRDGHFHLHAWAEIYIPGGGWRGYDPTLGLAVSDAHIAVCATADPEDAAPVSGTFHGTDVESTLETHVEISGPA